MRSPDRIPAHCRVNPANLSSGRLYGDAVNRAGSAPDQDVLDSDAAAADEYRPVSGMAVAAAIFGVLSLAAAIHPSFFILSVLGVVFAMVAIRDLWRADSIKIGRLAALVGLALSLFFGCVGLTRSLTATWIANRRAEEVAAGWVDAVRDGRILEAHGLVMPLLRVNAPGEAEGAVSTGLFDSRAIEAAYRQHPEVAAILTCGAAKREAARLMEYVPDSKEREEVWIVRVTIAPCGSRESLTVDIEVESALVKQAAGWFEQWYVKNITVNGKPPS